MAPGPVKFPNHAEGAPVPRCWGPGRESQTADSAATNFNRLRLNGNSTYSTYDGNGKTITMVYDAFGNLYRTNRPARRPAFRDRSE